MTAVGEGDRRRSVPGFHHGSVVFVKRPQPRIHGLVLFPGFRDQHQGGLGKRVARHGQKLERIVKGCRVALTLENERPELFEIVAEDRRRNVLFARENPVEVAAQRIDFTVVSDVAEGMSELPLRESVG